MEWSSVIGAEVDGRWHRQVQVTGVVTAVVVTVVVAVVMVA